MGRKKIDWDSLNLKDYPLKNLLGKERTLQRQIERRDVKIQKLKDSIQNQIQQINIEKMNIKGELRQVRMVIKEKSKDETNGSIWVLRGKPNYRGKWRRFGIDKFVHIGKPTDIDKYTNSGKPYNQMTDEELIKIIKIKLGKSLTKPSTKRVSKK